MAQMGITLLSTGLFQLDPSDNNLQLKLSRAVTVDMLEISTSVLPYFTVLH
jgi:hypothetical protein